MVNGIISLPLMVLYIFVMIVQIRFVLNFTKENADFGEEFILLLSAVITFLQIALPSVFADNLRHESENLVHQIYSCNWLDQSLKFKRMLIMTLQRAQDPLSITSVNFIPCSLNTHFGILKNLLIRFMFCLSRGFFNRHIHTQ